MRFLLAVCVVLGLATAASAAPMRMPRCLGPDTWVAIVTCMRGEQPEWAVAVELSAHARALTDAQHASGRLYVQELDGRWRNQRGFGPTVHVASDRVVALGGAQVLRIELREVFDYGNRTQVRMRSAVICGAPAAPACQLQTYGCAALAAGRTTEIVQGELAIANGAIQLVADRTRAGAMCNL